MVPQLVEAGLISAEAADRLNRVSAALHDLGRAFERWNTIALVEDPDWQRIRELAAHALEAMPAE